MSHRIQRVNNLIRHEISEMLQRQVKDPRLSTFITVTDVATSPDFKYAKISVSYLASAEEKQETLGVLAAASGFFRRELGKRLDLPHIPELTFQWDDSIERGAHLLQLIDQVSKETKPDPNQK
ncbi:MAG TPA: 30S ribosome-binding factor RbfA [Dehalococcoidales bacterium]|nr:30S ribosome-binding factor RbfA [Dehalococcoidales bacterium]